MKLAIMQPYFFPYIGYFQLINSVDKFLIYDDVNFIKQGWINKNKILLNNKAFNFVLSLENISSFKKINETQISLQKYELWKVKFYRTIKQAYNKAPFYKEIMLLLEDILNTNCNNISTLNTICITKICRFLNITTEIIPTSSIYNNQELNGQSRILDICQLEKASIYVNMIGGRKLYNSIDFLKKGILLKFLISDEMTYKQFHESFTPFLSVIDVLMFNGESQTNHMLNKYKLIEKND